MQYTLNVNGSAPERGRRSRTPLLWVLRDELDLKGTKFGCGWAVRRLHRPRRWRAIRSCIDAGIGVGEEAVTTIEAWRHPVGRKVQAAWLDVDVVQCGYCQAGQIMSASALLARKPKPTDADIDAAMTGNICRCATYTRIRAAIKTARACDDRQERGLNAMTMRSWFPSRGEHRRLAPHAS